MSLRQTSLADTRVRTGTRPGLDLPTRSTVTTTALPSPDSCGLKSSQQCVSSTGRQSERDASPPALVPAKSVPDEPVEGVRVERQPSITTAATATSIGSFISAGPISTTTTNASIQFGCVGGTRRRVEGRRGRRGPGQTELGGQ